MTFSSTVSRWHKKFGSIPGMFADNHAKAFIFFKMTPNILSSNSLHNELEFLPLYLPLPNLSSRPRSSIIVDVCLCYPPWLSCLDGDCVSAPTIFQTTLVELSCHLLVGLYSNYPTFWRGQLHLHVGGWGYYTQHIQRGSPQKQVVCERCIDDDVLDSNRSTAFSFEKVFLSSTYPRTST